MKLLTKIRVLVQFLKWWFKRTKKKPEYIDYKKIRDVCLIARMKMTTYNYGIVAIPWEQFKQIIGVNYINPTTMLIRKDVKRFANNDKVYTIKEIEDMFQVKLRANRNTNQVIFEDTLMTRGDRYE